MNFNEPRAAYYALFLAPDTNTFPDDAVDFLARILKKRSASCVTVAAEMLKTKLSKQLSGEWCGLDKAELPKENDSRCFEATLKIAGSSAQDHLLYLYREHDTVALVWLVGRSHKTIDFATLNKDPLVEKLWQTNDDAIDAEWKYADELWQRLQDPSTDQWRSMYGAVRIFSMTAQPDSSAGTAAAMQQLHEPINRRFQPFSFASRTTGPTQILGQQLGPNLPSRTQGQAPYADNDALICHFQQWLVTYLSTEEGQLLGQLGIYERDDSAPPLLSYFINLMKILRLDHLVRLEKAVMENARNIIKTRAAPLPNIHKSPNDVKIHAAATAKDESPIDVDALVDIVNKLGIEASNQAICAAGIRVAAFNCETFRRDWLVRQTAGIWGIGGDSRIDKDLRVIESALLQAATAQESAAAIVKQESLKVNALRASIESRRNELNERLERRFLFLGIFLTATVVAQLADLFTLAEGDFPEEIAFLPFITMIAAIAIYFAMRYELPAKQSQGIKGSLLVSAALILSAFAVQVLRMWWVGGF